MLRKFLAVAALLFAAVTLTACIHDLVPDLRPELKVTIHAEDQVARVGASLTFAVEVEKVCETVGCDLDDSDSLFHIKAVQTDGTLLTKSPVGYTYTFTRPGLHLVSATACYDELPLRCFSGVVTVWAVSDNAAAEPDCDVRNTAFSLKCVVPSEATTEIYQVKLYFNFNEYVESVRVLIAADANVFDLYQVNTDVSLSHVGPGPLPLSFKLPVRGGGESSIDVFYQIGEFRDTFTFPVNIQ